MRDNRGFVLVEMLMNGVAAGALLAVLALMSLQSVMAIPRLAETREETQLAALRWDLQHLADQQALFFADHRTYSDDTGELRFDASDAVEVSITASDGGWSATATHASLGPDRGCAVYVGAEEPPAEPMTPRRRGEVACTE